MKKDDLLLKLMSVRALKSNMCNTIHENDPVYFSKGLLMIEETLSVFRPGISNEERRRYIKDMVYSLYRFGCMFDEYFFVWI